METPDQNGQEGQVDPPEDPILDSDVMKATEEYIALLVAEAREGATQVPHSSTGPDSDADISLQALTSAVVRRHEVDQLLKKIERGEVQVREKVDPKTIQIRLLQGEIDYNKHARMLAKRHNSMVVTESFVRNAALYMATGDQQYLHNLDVFHTGAKELGFFLFRYSKDYMMNRLTARHDRTDANQDNAPRFIITETGAKHPNPPSTMTIPEAGIWAADCQLHLPSPAGDARSVLNLPRDSDESIHAMFPQKDEVKLETIVNDAVNHPWETALVEDIACDKRMANFGMAPIAMQEGLRVIKEEVNPKRGEHPIKRVFADIATITGLIIPETINLPGGDQRTLPEDQRNIVLGKSGTKFEKVSPIGNDKSFYMFQHYRSELSTNFSTAFILKNRVYPIDIPRLSDEPFILVVDWSTQYCDLK